MLVAKHAVLLTACGMGIDLIRVAANLGIVSSLYQTQATSFHPLPLVMWATSGRLVAPPLLQLKTDVKVSQRSSH